MGYRKVPTIYTLDLPQYEGLSVRMKSISFGKVRKLIAATETADDGNFDELLASIGNGIVSWNLEDENGAEIPATEDALNDQDFEFVLDIVQAWLGCMVGVSEDLGKGLTNGSQFPGQPVTMEAL